MKKLMSILLGLSLVVGTAVIGFASDDKEGTKKETKKKKSKKKKAETEEKK